MPNPDSDFHPVRVLRGTAGPFAGMRLGNVVAYDFALDDSFLPRPGLTCWERAFLLLDLGVQFANPLWWRGDEATSWYVDLVRLTVAGDTITVDDLYIDVIIPTDGRHYRQLDLDEFAESIEAGTLPLPEALDALTRWQRFLDRHLHDTRWPPATWADFPPTVIAPLRALPSPFGGE
jgi:hypothetical protein